MWVHEPQASSKGLTPTFFECTFPPSHGRSFHGAPRPRHWTNYPPPPIIGCPRHFKGLQQLAYMGVHNHTQGIQLIWPPHHLTKWNAWIVVKMCKMMRMWWIGKGGVCLRGAHDDWVPTPLKHWSYTMQLDEVWRGSLGACERPIIITESRNIVGIGWKCPICPVFVR